MPCRVGITTDPETRRAYWARQVVGFENWRILEKFRNRQEAQNYETSYASKYGCVAHAGGPDTAGIWHVYRFDYTRTR